AAQRHDLAVGKGARLAIGDVVHRYHSRDRAAERHGTWCGGKEFVERAAFVRLEMRERDSAQPLDRQYGTRACPRAARSADPWARQDDHADTEFSEYTSACMRPVF